MHETRSGGGYCLLGDDQQTIRRPPGDHQETTRTTPRIRRIREDSGARRKCFLQIHWRIQTHSENAFPKYWYVSGPQRYCLPPSTAGRIQKDTFKSFPPSTAAREFFDAKKSGPSRASCPSGPWESQGQDPFSRAMAADLPTAEQLNGITTVAGARAWAGLDAWTGVPSLMIVGNIPADAVLVARISVPTSGTAGEPDGKAPSQRGLTVVESTQGPEGGHTAVWDGPDPSCTTSICTRPPFCRGAECRCRPGKEKG